MSAPLLLRALALTLAHFGWQGALLGLLLLGALGALRRASPEARYAMAAAVLAAMAAAPPVTFALVARTLAVSPGPAAGPALSGARPAADPVSVAVALVWGAGVLAMLVRLVGGALRVRALVGRGRELPAPFRELGARIARQLDVGRAVRLLASVEIDVPVAVGWLRPVVLLPASMALGLPTPAVEALLAHELAHVRRHDFAINVAQSVVEALLFYHPAVWWVSARLRAERELCCDDAVVSLTGDALGYARALVSLETTRTAALGVAADGGSLMVRIERLVEGPGARRAARVGIGPMVAVTVALVAGAAGPLVSCASPADPAEATAQAAAEAQRPEWLSPAVARWTPSFVAAGQRYGVDPDLLAIVTYCESRGNPEATSPVGAVGLMQVMPATAARIAQERSLSGASPADLRDPEVNLDYGAFYLAKQLREFGAGQDPARAVELAAAAYNGGEDAVHAYLTEGKPLSDETVHYKDRVVSLWRKSQAKGR